MRKGEFLKLDNTEIEKQVSEVRKKWKPNVWNLDLGQEKGKIRFFQKMCACAIRCNFFSGYYQKLSKKDNFKMVIVKT